MKILLVSLAILFVSNLTAKEIKSSDHKISPLRVMELIKLVTKPDLQVSLVVSDLGGSTDVSPTQELFFNIYAKGEMQSPGASFSLGPIYSYKNSKRISGGMYEIQISGVNNESMMPEDQTFIIDAQKAIVALKKVQNTSEFISTIEVKRK